MKRRRRRWPCHRSKTVRFLTPLFSTRICAAEIAKIANRRAKLESHPDRRLFLIAYSEIRINY